MWLFTLYIELPHLLHTSSLIRFIISDFKYLLSRYMGTRLMDIIHIIDKQKELLTVCKTIQVVTGDQEFLSCSCKNACQTKICFLKVA